MLVNLEHLFCLQEESQTLFNKSGLVFLVFSKACFCLHFSTSPWLPLVSISGTLRPSNSSGLVYCGYSTRLESVNDSSRVAFGFFSTPWISITTELAMIIAGNSPPVRT